MLDKLKHITVNDKEYPIAFTLNVMENVQEKYGSMDKWSKELQPENGEEPKLKDVIWTFQEFLNEGIDIENEEKGEKRPFLTHKQVGRIISSVGMKEIGTLIRALTVESTNIGEEKNEMTTQSQN